ncbi:MAG: hypothetical protein EOM25_15025 [Deltaproteobacteria bacterium]|nr:hypothetical protein [Deltaproteobacteria bacterium]
MTNPPLTRTLLACLILYPALTGCLFTASIGNENSNATIVVNATLLLPPGTGARTDPGATAFLDGVAEANLHLAAMGSDQRLSAHFMTIEPGQSSLDWPAVAPHGLTVAPVDEPWRSNILGSADATGLEVVDPLADVGSHPTKQERILALRDVPLRIADILNRSDHPSNLTHEKRS